MALTSREVILQNIDGSCDERIGFNFDGGRRNDFCAGGVDDGLAYRQKRWTEGEIEYYDDAWGNLWKRMKDGCVKGEIYKPALEDWSQLNTFQAPEFDIAKGTVQLREAFAADTENRCKLACIGGWIFDNARYLRKMEVYFLDMALYPEELHRLHGIVAGFYEKRIQAAGLAKADAIMIGEDMGTQQGLLFSPAMFREYFKDMYTRLVGIAHEYGMKVLLHSCGSNWQIIDDLLDVGIDCFQFDQPMVYDMDWLAAKFRERHGCLWSPTDIQKVLPTGNREYIEAETRRLVETFRGRLIAKNYPDLPGIGVKPEWDQWAYEAFVQAGTSLTAL
jgi:uroporphyrinogen decarboxylase